jgi:Histidine kinase-, DNA gyrase B-, and HSP90-like ATPase
MLMTGDPKLLAQAFNILLVNAIKYSPAGAKIVLVARQTDSQFAVTVQDPGIGIPKEDLEHIFTRYYRGGNVSGFIGTGIGLFLVGTVLRLHGGEITVESEEGRGTRFTAILPETLPIPLWIAAPRSCARKARIVASSCAGRWTSIPGQISAPPTVRPTCWPPSCSDSLRTWRRSPHGAVISTSAMSVCWHRCLRQGGSALPECRPHCASSHHMFYVLTANRQERTALIREAGILAVFHYVPLVLVPSSKSLYRRPGPPLRTRWAVPRYWWWQRLRGAGPGRCRDRLRAAGARYRRRPGSACPGY